MGGKLAYRSENDFLFSMMNYEEEFVVPEPGLNGKEHGTKLDTKNVRS